MRSEVLLYGYGLVCLSMLVFNISYNIILRRSDRKFDQKTAALAQMVRIQLNRVRAGMQIEKKHMTQLQKKLSNINYLIAFDPVMTNVLDQNSDLPEMTYKKHLYPVFLQLAIYYRDRDSIEAAYFAYFISKHNIRGEGAALEDILVEYMKKESLYSHVNAFQALCDIGSAESVVKAIMLLDRRGSIPHEKILTDILLSFSGSCKELIDRFWEQFDKLSVKTQLAILNYIRFQTGEYCEKMYEIMTCVRRDKELRLAAIRYFGKYRYEPAKRVLLDFIADKDPQGWEYTATSVTSIATYEGEDVKAALIHAVHSANWYVRFNAANSLEALHLDYTDLIDVLSGSDRYAREMIMYRLDFERMKIEAGGVDA
ncbi:MAG: HEAT repeat domain-containing protein [Lachnospiraceae bacterium]|nr:HEAT repeat domain-containing protein [Lachnospiraceae bacterium]